MRKIVFAFCFITSIVSSQNKQVLYDFANLPQTLLLNPGAEVPYKFHAGIPLLSQFSFNAGFTGFSTYDVFADNGVPINDKIRAVVYNFNTAEFAMVNEQLEIINVGFRLPNKSYLSFGYYQEFDFLSKIPKDLVDLFYNGNTINEKYSINKLAARAELLGVFHVGLSKQLRKNLQVGVRAKIYSGAFNASSKNNSGTLSTTEGTNNLYSHHLQNVHVLGQTSGVILDDYDAVDPAYLKNKLLLGGNLGLGVDVGFTYHPEKQWEISGSMLDIGFINNTQNVESYSINGDYSIEGFQLFFDQNNPEDYWQNIQDDFEESVVVDTIYNKYISLRPLKVYGAVSYSFGQSYNDCRVLLDPNSYNNKVGFQLFSTFGAVHSYAAATVFFEKKLTKKLSSKVTYTVDPFSFSNIGLGVSTQLGWFNAYIIADNLLTLSNVYNAKSTSMQFGLNIIVNHKN